MNHPIDPFAVRSSRFQSGIGWLAPALALAILSLAGCTHQNSSTAATGTSGGGGILPIEWTTVSLTDAKPLIKLEGSSGIQLPFKIKPPNVERTIYFGELANGDDQTLPIIVVREKGQLIGLRMEPAWSADQWQQAVSGPAAGEVWGIIDQAKENAEHVLTLVHTIDQGKTWQVGAIRKPCDEAAFSDLVLDEKGRGRLTLALTDPCVANPKLKPGLFHYRTTDDGKTWSTPEYEPDATRPAEDVPDEEQPTRGQTAAVTLAPVR